MELFFVIVGRIALVTLHRYNIKHYIPVLFDDVPDPSSLPARRYVGAW